MTQADPTIPDYGGACTANLVPELIKCLMGRSSAEWLPEVVRNSKQIVLLVVDGLGWEQLQSHSHLLPTLSAFEGGAITTVAPTTTVVGLTSIVTGRPPSVHGILGNRLAVGGDDVLDVLKWRTSAGDARQTIVPGDFQVQPAFAANEIPAVTEQHFQGTGFTDAHMQGARIVGYSVPSSLPLEVWRLAKAGEELIYAYYNGVDKIAHAQGMGEHYDAELYTVDRLLRDLLAGLPPGCTLLVTADHGQVQVGGRNLDLDSSITELCSRYSGEGRFRWLHARSEEDRETLVERCRESVAELAWVHTRRELIDKGWFGGPVSDYYAGRLGDVALVAREAVAFKDPTHDGERHMQCRHGSLTSAEVLVPLLAQQA